MDNFIIFILDYLVVGSDSGKIVILEYNAQKNIFDKVTKTYIFFSS